MEAENLDQEIKVARLSKDELRMYLKRKPALAVFHIALEWSMIAAAIALTLQYFNPFTYVICVLWIGARQHALGVLMHDASHGNLFNSQKMNYWISDLFLAWPLFISTKVYWQGHSVHHKHTKNEKDPDWTAQSEVLEYQLPKTWGQFLRIFLRDISGLGVFQLIRLFVYLSRRPQVVDQQTSVAARRWQKALRVLYYVGILSLIHVLGGWKIFGLFWLVPLITWFKWIVYLRSLGEHHGFTGSGPLGHTRTTLVSVFGKFFITPKNINYHMEHHVYPGLPFYNLPQVHHLLMQRPEYRKKVRVTRGYLRVLGEAVNFRSTGPSQV